MNAEDLITEVIDIVQTPPYDDEDTILDYLNQSVKVVADKLLMPDLANGYSVVTALAGQDNIALPEDYHKGLFLVQIDGKPVDIHKDLKTMSMAKDGGSAITYDDEITAVAVNAGRLYYQGVPSTDADLELFYYRLPATMNFSSTPEGLAGNDDFEWALIHKACAKIFNKIEDGMEGQKVNTLAHESFFKEKLQALDEYADREGKSFPIRPPSNIGWLGCR